jgi:hypothetical protein
MPKGRPAVKIDTTVRNACADAAVDLLDIGGTAKLQIWSGAAPSDPSAAPAGTKLAEITLKAPAFGAAATGVATLDVTGGLSNTAAATGTAGFARLVNGAGAGRMDLTVSDEAGSGEVKLASTSIVSGTTVSVTSGTITMPAS